MPADERASATDALTVLREGAVELQGRMPWSSNATFLAQVTLGEAVLPAVYKPHRGERPLWDFPDGLYRREAAAYELSEALGWGIVPETIVRDDGPLGTGSFQRFVPADFSQHYFTLLELEHYHPALRRMAVFDVVANNADRKGGHCLLGKDGQLYGIDNGLCFHIEPKLRTVIWDFGGDRIEAGVLAEVEPLAGHALAGLDGLLHPREIEAIRMRARSLLRHRRFPDPPESHRAYPWPLV